MHAKSEAKEKSILPKNSGDSGSTRRHQRGHIVFFFRIHECIFIPESANKYHKDTQTPLRKNIMQGKGATEQHLLWFRTSIRKIELNANLRILLLLNSNETSHGRVQARGFHIHVQLERPRFTVGVERVTSPHEEGSLFLLHITTFIEVDVHLCRKRGMISLQKQSHIPFQPFQTNRLTSMISSLFPQSRLYGKGGSSVYSGKGLHATR